jgi:hypothetical protein
VNDLSLLVSGHCPPSVIRSGTLKCTTGESSPVWSPFCYHSVIFPRLWRQSQRQHQNHFESWIYPSKTQRGISLFDIDLFEKDIRLVMQNIGLFMDFELVWLRHNKGPLGRMESGHEIQWFTVQHRLTTSLKH